MHYSGLMLRQYGSRPIFPRNMHFKETMAMRLKNRLRGTSENLNAAYCVQELSSMVACMKKTDFDEAPCSKEIVAFQECIARESKAVKDLQESLKAGAVSPDAVRLSYRQLNNIFEKWPIPGARNKKSWIMPASIKYSDEKGGT